MEQNKLEAIVDELYRESDARAFEIMRAIAALAIAPLQPETHV